MHDFRKGLVQLRSLLVGIDAVLIRELFLIASRYFSSGL